MVQFTPFHPRTSVLNETSLWRHWAGWVVPEKYQMDEKVEYFAVRNAAGLFDTSPLFKYRIWGADAERYLSGVLARDIRRCRPGWAQYTMWCDDRGFVIEDGVVLRASPDEYFLTSAEPNLAYLRGLTGHLRVEIDDISSRYGLLALQGPHSRSILVGLVPETEELKPFQLTSAKIGNAPVIISRTGYTGDLGYEIWVETADAVEVWDQIMEAGAARRLIPFGNLALRMLRIEAGLVLIGVDFESSRFAWTEEQCVSPVELGYGWMFRDLAADDRPFIGRGALLRELSEGTSRWKLAGLVLDWDMFQQAHKHLGLPTAKDHVPVQEAMMVYDDAHHVVGFSSSYMYSPLLQNHICLARLPPDLTAPGSQIELEIMINHRYYPVGATVTKLPFFNPERKTA
jgi:aminomethyltransferase